jgi:hypothetical protein
MASSSYLARCVKPSNKCSSHKYAGTSASSALTAFLSRFTLSISSSISSESRFLGSPVASSRFDQSVAVVSSHLDRSVSVLQPSNVKNSACPVSNFEVVVLDLRREAGPDKPVFISVSTVVVLDLRREPGPDKPVFISVSTVSNFEDFEAVVLDLRRELSEKQVFTSPSKISIFEVAVMELRREVPTETQVFTRLGTGSTSREPPNRDELYPAPFGGL